MNLSNYHSYLLSLFSEINGHIRNTENKYLTISISYLSLVTIISSVILNKMILTTININYIVVYILIILIGNCVIILQRWYRIWKEHYLKRCRELDNLLMEIHKEISESKDENSKISISQEQKPCWLQNNNNENPLLLGADSTLYYLTNLVNLGAVLKLDYDLFLLSERNLVKFIVPIVIIFVYTLFITIIQFTILPEKKDLSP